MCGFVLLAVACSSPDVSLGQRPGASAARGNKGASQNAGNAGDGASGDSGSSKGDAATSMGGAASSTGGTPSSTGGSASTTVSDAAASAIASAEARILASCPNAVEIDTSSGEGWADLRWTNTLPAFDGPACSIDEQVSVSKGIVRHALMLAYVVPRDGLVKEEVWSDAFDAEVTNDGCASCVDAATCAMSSGHGCELEGRTTPLPSAPFTPDSLPSTAGSGSGSSAGEIRFLWVQPYNPNTAPAEGRIIVHVSMSELPQMRP